MPTDYTKENPNWKTTRDSDGLITASDSDAVTDEYRIREHRRILSAGSLAGDRVRNAAGEDLGKIEEIMLDVESGKVAYAVLSFGGFLGMGNKLFALPWEALGLNQDDHEFILDVDKATLEQAPGFDKENWPDMADPTWGSQIHSHYGYKPYWETSDAERDEKYAEKRSEKTLGGGSY